MKPIVETYRLFASNGRYIRIATKVIFPDGYVMRFWDRLPKRAAIAQAIEHREKHETITKALQYPQR